MKEDYSGTSTTHRMVNEIIPPSEFVNGNIVLSKGSYFAASLTLINTASGQPLTKGLDYKYRILDSAATGHSGGKFVYSLIELKTEITAPLSATYQYVGGEYVQQRESILRMLELQQDTDLSKIYYSRLKNRPNSFDVTLDHLHDASEITGKDEEIAALANIHEALQRIGDNVALGTEHDVIKAIYVKLGEIDAVDANQAELIQTLFLSDIAMRETRLVQDRAIVGNQSSLIKLATRVMNLEKFIDLHDETLPELYTASEQHELNHIKQSTEIINNQTDTINLSLDYFRLSERVRLMESSNE